MIILVFLPVIAALIYVIKKKTGMYTGVLLTCVGLAAGALVLFGIFYASTGTGLYDSIRSYVNSSFSSNTELAQVAYALLNNVSDYTTVSTDVAVASLTDYMTDILICAVPAVVSGFCTIFGLVLYLAVRAVVKKTGRDVHVIRRFRDFRLPKYFGRCSAICYVVVLIGLLNGWQNFDIVYSVVAAILGCVYYIQGLCFAEYFLESRIRSLVGRIFIYAAITLILYQILMFIGIFEQAVKMRRRMDASRASKK